MRGFWILRGGRVVVGSGRGPPRTSLYGWQLGVGVLGPTSQLILVTPDCPRRGLKKLSLADGMTRQALRVVSPPGFN